LVEIHHVDVGRTPVFAAIAHRSVGSVTQVPFTLPDHLAAGFLLEQRSNVRLPVLVRQAGPQNGLGHAIDRRKAARDHEAARRRALARRRIGALEIVILADELRAHAATEGVVDAAQRVRTAVDDGHVGPHPGGDPRRVGSHRAAAEHDHFCRHHAGDTAQQHAAPAIHGATRR
jgi:hypothetical protein